MGNRPMVLVKGSLSTTSTNDRSEKIIGKRNKYKMKKIGSFSE